MKIRFQADADLKQSIVTALKRLESAQKIPTILECCGLTQLSSSIS
jgi:hypothetical protein